MISHPTYVTRVDEEEDELGGDNSLHQEQVLLFGDLHKLVELLYIEGECLFDQNWFPGKEGIFGVSVM